MKIFQVVYHRQLLLATNGKLLSFDNVVQQESVGYSYQSGQWNSLNASINKTSESTLPIYAIVSKSNFELFVINFGSILFHFDQRFSSQSFSINSLLKYLNLFFFVVVVQIILVTSSGSSSNSSPSSSKKAITNPGISLWIWYRCNDTLK